MRAFLTGRCFLEITTESIFSASGDIQVGRPFFIAHRTFGRIGRCVRRGLVEPSVGATDALSERMLITVSMCRSISPTQDNGNHKAQATSDNDVRPLTSRYVLNKSTNDRRNGAAAVQLQITFGSTAPVDVFLCALYMVFSWSTKELLSCIEA